MRHIFLYVREEDGKERPYIRQEVEFLTMDQALSYVSSSSLKGASVILFEYDGITHVREEIFTL